MNPIVWILGGAGVAMLLELWILDRAKNKAYKLGRQEGYDEGVKDGKTQADNWWFNTESDVDQARVKIWREEDPKRGADEGMVGWP